MTMKTRRASSACAVPSFGGQGGVPAQAIDDSPAMLAQSRRLRSGFGAAAPQRVATSAEDRLQARFDAGAAASCTDSLLCAADGAQLFAIGRALQLEGGAAAAGRFVVDAGQTPADGQVTKDDFLAEMQTRVLAISKEVLSPFGMAQADCPDLNYWVEHYRARDAAHLEQVIARYAPAAQGARDWRGCLDALVQRIRTGLVDHTHTGAPVDPEPMPDSIDRERPPLSVFGIQRKAAPVAQLGCGSEDSIKTGKSTEQKTDGPLTETKTPATSAGTATGTAHATPVSLQVSALRTADEIRRRAGELGALFRAGHYLDIGALLRATEPPEVRDSKVINTTELYITDYLSACSSTATAISQYVIGKDITPTQSQKTNTPMLLPKGTDEKNPDWTLAPAFETLLQRGDGYYHLSATKVSHHFIVIAIGGSYDVYESDANPGATKVIHFLPTYNLNAQHSQTRTQLTEADLATRLGRIMLRCKHVAGTAIPIDYRYEAIQ